MVSSRVEDNVVPTASSDSLHQVTESDLPDLSGIPLAHVRSSDDSVLTHALALLIKDIEDPDEVVAGFQSAL